MHAISMEHTKIVYNFTLLIIYFTPIPLMHALYMIAMVNVAA